MTVVTSTVIGAIFTETVATSAAMCGGMIGKMFGETGRT